MFNVKYFISSYYNNTAIVNSNKKNTKESLKQHSRNVMQTRRCSKSDIFSTLLTLVIERY